MSGPHATAPENPRASYGGWVAGALVIVGVLGVGVAFWFMHHP